MKLRIAWLVVIFALPLFLFSCGDDDDDDDSAGTEPIDDTASDDSGDDSADDTDDETDDDSVDDTNDDTGDDSSDDTGDDADDDSGPEYPHDDEIRVNHVQSLGTHNSYHMEPPFLIVPSYHYTHKPLDEQLDIGVRQFELDLHYLGSRPLRVYHAPVIDQRTTCGTLVECMTVIKDWSDDHPGHQPIFVMLEPKNDLGISDIADHSLDVEADILSVWPRERILTPDDVRGEYSTLREAILTEGGWPTLGETRNKIFFNAHSQSDFLAEYRAIYPGLVGALMFTDSSVDDDYAAFMPMNDPIGDAASIAAAVAQGFLVRTMAANCCDDAEALNYSGFEAALETGANFISSDFPAPNDDYDYWVEIPDGTPSRCNPSTAPDFCTSEDIENL